MKKCTVCNEEKPLDEFYNYKTSKDGKSYRCKSCDSAARRQYYLENETSKEKRLERTRKHRYKTYGITPEEYDSLLKEQDHKCGICGGTDTHSPSKYFSVDHCHDTGKIRGLLCNRCNRGLGFLGDTSSGLQKALEYLKKAETH